MSAREEVCLTVTQCDLSRDTSARAVYTQRAERHAADRQRLANRSRAISYLRVATFVAAAACALVGATSDRAPTGELYITAAVLFVAFFGLIVWHAGIEQREQRHGALQGINEAALARLDREWARLPASAAGIPASHAYAGDLDLFGRASLFTLLWNTGTRAGRDRLAEWLLTPAAPHEVRLRQSAVDELAPLIDTRQEVIAAAVTGSVESHEVMRFLDWAESEPWLSPHRAAAWAIRALTAGIAALVILRLAGFVHGVYWLAPVVVSFILSNVLASRVERVFNRAFAHHAVFRHYSDLFRLVLSAPVRAPLLRDLQATLVCDGRHADREMSRLQRLMELADLRHSALFHFPVQIATLWDFHIVLLVEAWQRRARPAVRRWFDALASFEALAALAALRFDNPSWAFAELDQAGVVEAVELGHPLLPPNVRVDNHVGVGPPGTFLLVTGSNMSGKSTLLRAIGVNVVLAQAGAPVCARRLRLPSVRLYTSMRVQDSLEEGVSFFMAAVKRLKQVVEAADRTRDGEAADDDRLLLYLLDEVLQGTNTAERQIAVRSVLRHLLAQRAIGAVTTHDLALAATPDLAAAARPVHFTETLQASEGGGSMTFDYRLRPGLATSRNALRLMQMVGLEVEEGGRATDDGT